MDAVVQRKISTIGPKKMRFRLVIVVWPCPYIRICCPLFSRRRSLYRMSWTVGYQALIYSPDIQISGYTWNKNASENNVHLTLFYLQYSEMFVLNYYQKQNTTPVYHALIIVYKCLSNVYHHNISKKCLSCFIIWQCLLWFLSRTQVLLIIIKTSYCIACTVHDMFVFISMCPMICVNRPG